MRRALLPLFLFASLAAPAAALANSDHGGARHHQPSVRGVAGQQCRDERAQIGRLAFQQKYRTPHAFKNCVRAHGGSDKGDDNKGDGNGDNKGDRKHDEGDQNGDNNGDQNGHHDGDN